MERETPAESRSGANSRAAQAAARVAARYAQAPSYSQMQAAEARTAVRAAEIATQVALEAQAAARAALAGLKANDGTRREAAGTAPPMALPAPKARPQPRMDEPAATPTLALARGPEAAARSLEFSAPAAVLDAVRASLLQPLLEAEGTPENEWWNAPRLEDGPTRDAEIDGMESALPELQYHANLIEFPHEMASQRRSGGRLIREPLSRTEDPDHAISIFEVDPSLLVAETAGEDTWSQPVEVPWTAIELEAPPEEIDEPLPTPAAQAPVYDLAPFGLRLMAGLVDITLIAGALLVAAMVALTRIGNPPQLNVLELAGGAGFLVVGLLYQAIFFTLSNSTPGMKYAGISLCTFEGQVPTPTQLQGRLGALLLSLLPLGLGVVWAVFDENALTWHDRLSRTYQRRW